MSNIIVTGGAGFVGSHLIKKLSENSKNNIWSIDDYSTGTENNHIKSDNVKYIKCHTKDINKIWDIEEVIGFFDAVFHFGEYSRVEPSIKEIDVVSKSNCEGTFSVLEFCRKTKTKLIYSASSTKFGDDGNNINKSPYAFFKCKNVDLIKNYKEWYNLDYKILYFYNVYGPGQIESGTYATVIGIFEKQYREGLPITVVHPGTQTRDFTHVGDIVSGIIQSVNFEAEDEIFLGTGKSYRIIDVAKMFSEDIIMLPPRKTERMNTDIVKSESFNWKAKVNLEDYIKQVKNE